MNRRSPALDLGAMVGLPGLPGTARSSHWRPLPTSASTTAYENLTSLAARLSVLTK